MNTKEHKGTGEDKLSGPEVGQTVGQTKAKRTRKVKRNLSGAHVDHWSKRLVKRTYTDRTGQTGEASDWSVKIQYRGHREWFNTRKANKADAAAKARDIYDSLQAHGWEPTLDKFKRDMETKDGTTVGEFLAQVKAVSGLRPVTFEIYSRKLRSLVAGVFEIDGGKAKHDYVNGGHKEWLARVHAIKLHRLTPEAVNKWKVSAMASDSPIQQKHNSATVRSILLCSKAMFSKAIRKHLTVKLPSPLPFEDVVLPKVGNRRYRSEINPSLLLQQANAELAEARPELFKAFLLAIGAGLRRDEIDKLQWSQIKWDKSLIRIEVTEHGGTKSRESEADVHVDSGLLEILKGYLPKPGKVCSQFVIESPVAPRPQSVRNHHYRCNKTFKQLIEWLRSKGLKARNGIHALRKEFGSLICQQAGIFAASSALRHSSIALTRDVYVDNKAPAVLNIGSLLSQPQPAEKKTGKAKAKTA